MRILFAGALLCSLSLAGCDALDTKEDLNLPAREGGHH